MNQLLKNPPKWTFFTQKESSFLIKTQGKKVAFWASGYLEQIEQIAIQKGLEFNPNTWVDLDLSLTWLWGLDQDHSDENVAFQYKSNLWATCSFDHLLHQTLCLPLSLQSIATTQPWPIFFESYFKNSVHSEYSLITFSDESIPHTIWIMYYRHGILADAHHIYSTHHTLDQITQAYIHKHISNKWMDETRNDEFQSSHHILSFQEVIPQIMISNEWIEHSQNNLSIWSHHESSFLKVTQHKKQLIKVAFLTSACVILLISAFLFSSLGSLAIQYYQNHWTQNNVQKYIALKESLNKREQLNTELAQYLQLLQKRTPHALILEKTQNALPPQVWLSSWQVIELKQTLKGQTLNESSLNTFLKNLEAQFELVQLKTRTQKNNKINFEIEIGRPSTQDQL